MHGSPPTRAIAVSPGNADTAGNENSGDRTTFIIAHRIQSVMKADLILVLDKGEVVQMGTHDKLVTQKDSIYRRIYDIQTRIDEELELEVTRVN